MTEDLTCPDCGSVNILEGTGCMDCGNMPPEIKEGRLVSLTEDLNFRSAVEIMGFSWSEQCEYDLGLDGVATPGNWDPLHDMNQCMMIVKKMREQRSDGSDGFNFNFNWQAHKGITISLASFHRIDGNLEFGQGADNDPHVAIITAALAAKATEVAK